MYKRIIPLFLVTTIIFGLINSSATLFAAAKEEEITKEMMAPGRPTSHI